MSTFRLSLSSNLWEPFLKAMTTLRIGLSAGQAERNGTLTSVGKPALLVSFVYLHNFQKFQAQYSYRDWALDSGAYSAFNSGTVIDLKEYIATCKHLQKTDKTLTDIFSLDVIGNPKASLKNAERMWAEGIPAIPTFHYGSPWSALMDLAKLAPKIGIGGVRRVGKGVKFDFAKQVFARVWPKKLHGFAYGSEEHIMALPFHSVDCTTWELAPCAFGRWRAFGNMSVRGSSQNLRAEIDWYMKLERKAQQRWKTQMLQLESVGEALTKPALRLGAASQIPRLHRRSFEK